ncbi:hypothetical protein [Sphingobacterium anhuiense]|uniref:Uncharacterized protein n=1 Tax=Sphingobacterium anhuiense TaxID=493780 RepID=A0ABW5YXE1_9SPHI
MNLDELKTAWNSESTNDVRIPAKIKQLGQAKHPLDKLKRKMKNEWYMQFIAILFLLFFPQVMHIHPSLYIIYYTSYALLVVISVYYLNLFRLFYNKINDYTADTKDSLLEIYYELKINIERYHAFGFLLLPVALVAIALYVNTIKLERGDSFTTESHSETISFIILTLVVSFTFILSILAWTKYIYSPYVKQLKKILDELKEEELKENEFSINNSNENIQKDGRQ